ncbi:unnamed protein product [Peniophora sp. CBMAI 1063]|nr:unnamed protein product [Peniophora sp. CBMAI 1063]
MRPCHTIPGASSRPSPVPHQLTTAILMMSPLVLVAVESCVRKKGEYAVLSVGVDYYVHGPSRPTSLWTGTIVIRANNCNLICMTCNVRELWLLWHRRDTVLDPRDDSGLATSSVSMHRGMSPG